MEKIVHLLVLSCLIIFLLISGCIGNDSSKDAEVRKGLNYTEGSSNTSNGSTSVAQVEDLEVGLTQAELKELDSDMSDLEGLLENSSVGEDIVIENAETGKSENLTKK